MVCPEKQKRNRERRETLRERGFISEYRTREERKSVPEGNGGKMLRLEEKDRGCC